MCWGKLSTDEWLDVQKRYLNQLQDLLPAWDVPILFAGDLFDRSNPSCELLNFCMDSMPEVYGIPGQHDLPLHQLEDINKSGFGTLVKSKKIQYLDPKNDWCYFPEQHMVVLGFPWGIDLKPYVQEERGDTFTRIAIVHKFLWKDSSTSYPGAPESQQVMKVAGQLDGFTIAAFGDNHACFKYKDDNIRIINCGTLIRRKISELDYKPSVGLLHGSGKITRHYLDTSQDKFVEVGKIVVAGKEIFLDDFVEDLRNLTDNRVSFPDAVVKYIESNSNTRPAVIDLILGYLEQVKN